MRKVLSGFILLLITLNTQAQVPGDTIKVKTFHYGSNNRDTVAVFPDGSLTFEKIIMKYSMRCKNGLVSDGINRNQGCGEWDYSCNTYIVDSSKIEDAPNSQANYVISNFTGTSFPYTSIPVYDYFDFTQQRITVNSIGSDSVFSVLSATDSSSLVFKSNRNSGKSQFIYGKSELLAAGLTAGNIHSIILNVTNTGGKTGFLKVRIRHTDAVKANSGAAEMTGFSEVYNANYVFVNGSNRIVFKTPFNWNGNQNLLLEFSYTNSVPDNEILFSCHSDSITLGLTNNNNFALDLSNNAHVKLDTNLFSSIKNEMSIAFWAYGNAAQMPVSTTILYGTDNNANNRQLNIHLPHSNKNIYFDCGFASGGYDRIFQPAQPADMGGRWNHWTFTKNATTGIMNVYLNGNLWLTGTGKVKAITLINLILGKDVNLQNNYKGKINELAIWNKVIPDSFVKVVMNTKVSDLTSFNNNLVGYYPMNEGSGQVITENTYNKTSTGINFQWTFDRGDKLSRGFSALDLRPVVSFTRSVINASTQTITVRDSVRRNPNIIEQYSVTSKAGVTPMTNDVLNLVSSTSNLYQATPRKVYNGDIDTLFLLSTIPTDSEGVYTITNLTYYKRYPFYNEIMSFVTPYGIGLDLGINGKSWYYDVSDFAPLLKGNKRILMAQGGERQEQNDIEFWFIVGTPVRTVLEFNQLWQGVYRAGGAALTAINNDTRFAPVSVPLLASGKAFKIRSSITGHGNEGEFENNGGPVDHMLNINGGPTEFTWKIVMPCADNPVYPQGGTWIYDRQGWCPGKSSLLKENFITPYVTAGSNASIDYNASTPPKPGGAYSYLAHHQIITYSAPNFNLDARIMEVIKPSDKIFYGRANPLCAAPVISVQNSGTADITNIEFSYWINTAGTKQSYTWTGNLASMQTATVTLPVNSLWNTGMLGNGNQFHVEIKSVNNKVDDNTLNNNFISGFNLPQIVPSVFTVEFFTNKRPTENSYKILDELGNLIDSQSFNQPNKLYSKTYNLGGCFKIVVTDLGEDGIYWWADTAQGTGYMRIKRANGSILKTFQPDFGSGFEYSFTTNWALSQEELRFGTLINMYPNPSAGNFVLEGKELENAEVKITDLMGRKIEIPFHQTGNKINFDGNILTPGIYLVVVEKGTQTVVKKLMIE